MGNQQSDTKYATHCAGDNDDAADQPHVPYWTHDPHILVYQCFEVVPYGWMSPNRKANALTRLALLVGLVLLVNRMRGGNTNTGVLFVMATLVAVVFAIILMSRRMSRPECELVATGRLATRSRDRGPDPCDGEGRRDVCGDKATDDSDG